MSVIAISNIKNKIRVATDSRLFFESGISSDLCIKLFSIPVNIVIPISPPKGFNYDFENIYSKKWCLAIPDGQIHGVLMKEMLTGILSEIVYMDKTNDFQFDDIFKYILNLLDISTNDMLNPKLKSPCQLFIAGYDPNLDKVRLYDIYEELIGSKAKFILKEIKLEELQCVVKGTVDKSIIKKVDSFKLNVCDVVKLYINTNKKVGGKVQYGEFNPNNNFEICSILEEIEIIEGTAYMVNSISCLDFEKDNLEIGKKLAPGHTSKDVYGLASKIHKETGKTSFPYVQKRFS